MYCLYIFQYSNIPKILRFLKSIYISIILEYVCKNGLLFGAFGIWSIIFLLVKIQNNNYKNWNKYIH